MWLSARIDCQLAVDVICDTCRMDAFGRFERAGWQEKAGGYQRLLARITDRVADHLLDAAEVTAGTRLLDVACGHGYATARAAERGASATGVDQSAAMLALARAHHPRLDFREAAAEELPFDGGTFAAVVGNFLLPHLADPDAVVAELARVTAPRGRLALTAWDLPQHARFVGVLVDALAEAGAVAPAGLPEGPPFFRYAERESLVALFESAGFGGVEVTTVAFEHRVDSADELWQSLMEGTVRMSAQVLGQPPEVRERIRAAFDARVARYARGSGLSLPVSAKLAAGRLPR
ncbi:class I SAM-dependent methyltransferase [Phytohabitans houttuyneae]|uniref:Methyltransferase n=1 Tax=Phytohabitans houttuyneae TaxID=1076126 RepID=A0A6V8KK15_9ACTN|nr:class I SAM-dependent methyltransferase [Phytohabitans houttuyneae]GFJ85473.1 methyltransferase [Phytohabitans houttuyneae]